MPKVRKQPEKAKTGRWKNQQRAKELNYFVTHYLQEKLNTDYRNGSQEHGIKLENDQKVICLAKGLYYMASATYYRLVNPRTLFRQDEIVPVERRVLSYIIKLVGFPETKEHIMEIPENELIPLEVENPDPVTVLGMLTAHCWNVWMQSELNKPQNRMGEGLWFLEEDEYTELETRWRLTSGETVTFEEFYTRFYRCSKSISETVEFDTDEDATFSHNAKAE